MNINEIRMAKLEQMAIATKVKQLADEKAKELAHKRCIECIKDFATNRAAELYKMMEAYNKAVGITNCSDSRSPYKTEIIVKDGSYGNKFVMTYYGGCFKYTHKCGIALMQNGTSRYYTTISADGKLHWQTSYGGYKELSFDELSYDTALMVVSGIEQYEATIYKMVDEL